MWRKIRDPRFRVKERSGGKVKPEDKTRYKEGKRNLGKLIYDLSKKHAASLKQEDLDKYTTMRNLYKTIYGEEYVKKKGVGE